LFFVYTPLIFLSPLKAYTAVFLCLPSHFPLSFSDEKGK